MKKLVVIQKNVAIFIIVMFLGLMAYSGELSYVPIVLILLLIAVGIGQYGSER